MLGKLIKHEFHATYKFLLLLNFFTLAASLIGGIVINLELQNIYFPMFLYWSLTLAYVVLIWSSVLGTQIYLARRFYNSCFSSEGYLTFTLPVGPALIFSSKIITAVLWTLFNLAITTMGLSLTVFIPMFQGIPLNELSNVFSYLGMSTSIIINIFLVCIMGILSNILLIDFSLCVGQIAKHYRKLTTVFCYGMSFMLIQILHSFYTYINSIYFSTETSTNMILRNIFASSNIISVATIVILYSLSVLILKKKLNLA